MKFVQQNIFVAFGPPTAQRAIPIVARQVSELLGQRQRLHFVGDSRLEVSIGFVRRDNRCSTTLNVQSEYVRPGAKVNAHVVLEVDVGFIRRDDGCGTALWNVDRCAMSDGGKSEGDKNSELHCEEIVREEDNDVESGFLRLPLGLLSAE